MELIHMDFTTFRIVKILFYEVKVVVNSENARFYSVSSFLEKS